MNCFRNTDVIKTVLELVSCVWEKRVFPQAQVPYFCFTSRKLILKPKGLLLSAPLSPRSPVRARPDPDGFLSLGSRIPRLALHIPGCFVGFHGN